MKQTLKTTILFVLGILLWRCEAPRNNPLDPKNPDSELGIIEGRVQSQGTGANLPDVRIWWSGNGSTVRSDAAGGYVLENLPLQDGWLFFEKNGFHRDSVTVNWNGVKKVDLTTRLNAFPELQNLQVFSRVINEYFPTPTRYRVVIHTGVSDADNDVDSVFWELALPDTVLNGSLTDNGALFDAEFDPILFSLSNEAVVGYPIRITVKDLDGRIATVGEKAVQRVIKAQPVNLSPINPTSVPQRPTFVWERFNPGFAHTYRLEVFKIQPFSAPELFWSRAEIPQGTTEFQMDKDLDEAEYFWVIWAVDAFNNQARSRPTTFEYP